MRKRLVLFIALLCPCVAPAGAAELTLMVGDNPPFNVMANEQPKGMAVDIVTEMLKRAGIAAKYENYPWARAYMLAQAKPNYCLYSLARMPEREAQFQWIGPIAKNDWGLFALRKRHLHLKTLDDARRYRISAQPQDAKGIWLESHGFTVDHASTEALSFGKLLAGRVDLYPGGLYTMPELAAQSGVDPKTLQLLLIFHHTDNYLGCSQSTDAATLAALRQALTDMRAEHALEQIASRYQTHFAKPAD